MKPLLLLLGVLLSAASVFADTIKVDFAQGVSPWQEKIFAGRVDYQIVKEEGHLVLRAESRGRASALIHRLDVDPYKHPKLSWRWKVDRVLQKGELGTKGGDDYPARVYLIFDSWLANYATSINYIWASHAALGTVLPSPYYSRSVMIAVESGTEKVGEWTVVERDILRDYQRAFKGKVPKIKAIAIMTDGDDTGETNVAWYDWIEFLEDAD